MTDIDSNVANAAALTRPQPNRWAGQIWAFVTAVGIGNLLFAVVAGVVGAWLVTEPDNGGGVAAAVLVQAVTLPVLLARVAPAWAAGALAAGALLNEVVIGPMIRCGVIFPVMFVIVYQLGAADPIASAGGSGSARVSRRRRWSWPGIPFSTVPRRFSSRAWAWASIARGC